MKKFQIGTNYRIVDTQVVVKYWDLRKVKGFLRNHALSFAWYISPVRSGDTTKESSEGK